MPSQRFKGFTVLKGLEGFKGLEVDRGKRRRRSSTPAVVPGAAPALAKAGVGGLRKNAMLEELGYDHVTRQRRLRQPGKMKAVLQRSDR